MDYNEHIFVCAYGIVKLKKYVKSRDTNQSAKTSYEVGIMHSTFL